MKKHRLSYRYGFIGIGRMAEVILRAMLRAGIARPQEILVSRNSLAELKRLSRELKVHTTRQNREVAESCRWIWIGVKPHQAGAVLGEIRPHLRKGTTVLSMMAGISTGFIKKILGPSIFLVRLMPNTPALLGSGMTGVYFPASVPPSVRSGVQKILKPMGKALVCSREQDLDVITGLSGSGVAFIFYLAQGLITGGEKAGLTAAEAHGVALQTLRGAAHMLEHSGKQPEDLVAQVVSKGGTTEAGLKILKKRGAAAALAQAVQKAAEHAKTLRKENEKCTP